MIASTFKCGMGGFVSWEQPVRKSSSSKTTHNESSQNAGVSKSRAKNVSHQAPLLPKANFEVPKMNQLLQAAAIENPGGRQEKESSHSPSSETLTAKNDAVDPASQMHQPQPPNIAPSLSAHLSQMSQLAGIHPGLLSGIGTDPTALALARLGNASILGRPSGSLLFGHVPMHHISAAAAMLIPPHQQVPLGTQLATAGSVLRAEERRAALLSVNYRQPSAAPVATSISNAEIRMLAPYLHGMIAPSK